MDESFVCQFLFIFSLEEEKERRFLISCCLRKMKLERRVVNPRASTLNINWIETKRTSFRFFASFISCSISFQIDLVFTRDVFSRIIPFSFLFFHCHVLFLFHTNYIRFSDLPPPLSSICLSSFPTIQIINMNERKRNNSIDKHDLSPHCHFVSV